MLKRMMIFMTGTALLAGCATTQKVMSTLETPIETVANTPLEQVLELQPELKSELTNTEIRQVFNTVESPNVAQVMVLQAGLLDDSVNAIRTTYRFKLNQNELWQQVDKVTEYKCARGENTKSFQKKLCS